MDYFPAPFGNLQLHAVASRMDRHTGQPGDSNCLYRPDSSTNVSSRSGRACTFILFLFLQLAWTSLLNRASPSRVQHVFFDVKGTNHFSLDGLISSVKVRLVHHGVGEAFVANGRPLATHGSAPGRSGIGHLTLALSSKRKGWRMEISLPSKSSHTLQHGGTTA